MCAVAERHREVASWTDPAGRAQRHSRGSVGFPGARSSWARCRSSSPCRTTGRPARSSGSRRRSPGRARMCEAAIASKRAFVSGA